MLIRFSVKQAVAQAAVFFALWSGWQSASLAHAADTSQKVVAITAIVEHPALDATRQGVKEALQAAGYEVGKNLRWEYQSAQGNTTTAAQIARQFVGERPDAIVAISTPSAQVMVAATKTIPIVYAAITDPVAAGLVPSLTQASGTNVTGVSDALPPSQQIALIKRVVPTAKRVGMIYNPGEANSVAVVKQLKVLLPQQGLTLVEAAAPRTLDVVTAARSLVDKGVDVIYTGTDNNVVAAYDGLIKVARESKVPVVAADSDSVRRGAAAADGINYHDLGVQTGRIVVRILKGESPGNIPPQVFNKVTLSLKPRPTHQKKVVLSQARVPTRCVDLTLSV